MSPKGREYLTPAAILVTWVFVDGSFLCHLRFLRNIKPSFCLPIRRPPSSNALTSSVFSATLTVKSSLLASKNCSFNVDVSLRVVSTRRSTSFFPTVFADDSQWQTCLAPCSLFHRSSPREDSGCFRHQPEESAL